MHDTMSSYDSDSKRQQTTNISSLSSHVPACPAPTTMTSYVSSGAYCRLLRATDMVGPEPLLPAPSLLPLLLLLLLLGAVELKAAAWGSM